MTNFYLRSQLFSFLLIFVSLLILSSCATDSKPVYTLNTSVEPVEAGTVTQQTFQADEGDPIKITATPNEHWQFVSWTGDLSGTNEPTVFVNMDKDRNVTALFEKVDYPVTIEITGEGDVTTEVISQKTISDEFQHASTLKLTAEPIPGWEFIEWGGDVSGTDTVIELEVDGPVNLTALFDRIDYDLTVNVEGAGTVQQLILPATTTVNDYPFETMVQLTAVASFGWEFDRWTGDVTGTDPVAVIAMENEKEVTAIFKRQFFTLTIDVIGGEGNIQKSVNGAITTQNQFEFETAITLTAVPATGWSLNAWALEDDTILKDDAITVTMNGDRNIKVEFNRLPPTVPTVTIIDVSNINETSATVRGNVVDRGSAIVSERGFVYATSPSPPANALLSQAAGTGTGQYTATLTGLTPGTTYYVSPYAINVAGTRSGPGQLTFTTTGTAPSGSETSGGGGSGGDTGGGGSGGTSSGMQVALIFIDGVNIDVTLNGTLIPSTKGFDYSFGSAGVKVVNLSGNLNSMHLNPSQLKPGGLNNEGFGAFGYKMVNKNSSANLFAINASNDGNPEFWGQPASTSPLGVINNRSGDTVYDTKYPDALFYLGWRFDPVNQPNNRNFESQWSNTGKMAITFINYGKNHGNPAVP